MSGLRGIRPIACLTLIALATATQISLGSILGGGPDAVDIPLILLLWFALVDRWPRVAAVGAVIALSRVAIGASSTAAVGLPLLVAVLWMRFARHGIDPRDRGRRVAIVACGLALATLTHRLLWSSAWNGAIDSWATGILVGTAASVLLFPVFDLTTPLLRSADYPM